MRKPRKPSPTESPMLVEIDPTPLLEMLTAFGGVLLVVQTFRSLGLPAAVQREVQVIQERERGYDEATVVERFVRLNAVGGECFDDFARLRADPGLADLIGHAVPPPEAPRQFLYGLHDKALITAAQARRGQTEIAYLPEETAPLQGLARVADAFTVAP